MRSLRVVLPESMCAEMPKLRTLERSMKHLETEIKAATRPPLSQWRPSPCASSPSQTDANPQVGVQHIRDHWSRLWLLTRRDGRNSLPPWIGTKNIPSADKPTDELTDSPAVPCASSIARH